MRRWLIYANFAANAAGSIVSALTMLFVIRNLSVEDWGVSAAILGIGQFLGGAASFGTQTRMIRELSGLTIDAARQRGFALGLTRVCCGAVVVAVGVLVGCMFPAVGAVIALVGGVFVSLGATAPLIAQRRYLLAGSILILEKLLALVLAVSLVYVAHIGAYGLPFAIAVAGLVAGGVSVLSLARQGTTPPWRHLARDLRFIWKDSLHFGIAALAPSALLLDVAIISFLAGPVEAGIYAVGSRLMAPLSVAATSIVQILMPMLADRNASSLALPSKGKMFIWGGAILAVAAALMITLPPTASILLGGDYRSASGVIRLFVLNAMIVLLTRVLVTVLQAWRYESIAAALVAAQVAVALVGICVTSLLSSAAAAAAALVASNALLAVGLFIVLRRVWRVSR